jgi:hypothetical protein
VLEKIVSGIPVKRLGEPEEIASIVAWIASAEAVTRPVRTSRSTAACTWADVLRCSRQVVRLAFAVSAGWDFVSLARQGSPFAALHPYNGLRCCPAKSSAAAGRRKLHHNRRSKEEDSINVPDARGSGAHPKRPAPLQSKADQRLQ